MKKTVKRILSVILTIVLVATTFFIFDPSVLKIESEAAVTAAAQVSEEAITFYVPELIYLKPRGTNYMDTFQYYVDRDTAANSFSLRKGANTTGNFYFNCAGATNIKVTYSSNLSSCSITTTEVNADTLETTITGGVYRYWLYSEPGDGQSKTDTVTWTVTYTVGGVQKTATNYTVLYAPFLPVVAAVGKSKNTDGNDNHLSSAIYAYGFHSYNHDGAYSTVNQLSDVFSQSRTVIRKTDGSAFSDNGIFGSDRLCISGGDLKNAGGHEKESNSNNVEVTASATSPTANIVIDWLRYDYYDEVPNLKVGWVCTDDEDDGGDRKGMVDLTVGGTSLYSWGWGQTGRGYTDLEDYSLSPRDFGHKWISSGTLALYVHACSCDENSNSADRACNKLTVNLSVTTIGNTSLRTAITDAINAGRQEQNYTSSSWTNYVNAIKTCAERMGDPTNSSTSYSELTSAINGLQRLTATQTNVGLRAKHDGTYQIVSIVSGATNYTKNFKKGDTLTFTPESYNGYTFQAAVRDGNATVGSVLSTLPNSAYDSTNATYSNGTITYSSAPATDSTINYTYYYLEGWTISYDLDGGTVSGTNPTSYDLNTSPVKLINPTKTGYTFTGWTGSNGTTPEVDVWTPNVTDGQGYSGAAKVGGNALSGYTQSSPRTISGRDHIYGDLFEVIPGQTYRVFVKAKRTAGSRTINGGIWYREYTSGAPYDGVSGAFTLLRDLGNGWGEYYKDVIVPSGKQRGQFYLQIDQNDNTGYDTSWQVYDGYVTTVFANVDIGTLGDYNQSNPFVCNNRDNHPDPKIPLTTGHTYRIVFDAKQAAGTVGLKVGFWWTTYTAGTPYDNYATPTVAEDLGNGWKRYYRDVTIPSGKSAAQVFFQIEQDHSVHDHVWNVANISVFELAPQNLSYTAHWTADTYTIRVGAVYKTGNSSGYTMGDKGGTVGFTAACGYSDKTETWTYPTTTATIYAKPATGYYFYGWYWYYNTTIHTTSESVDSGFAAADCTLSGSVYSKSISLTTHTGRGFAAKFKPNCYTLAFNGNDGTGSMSNQTVYYGSSTTINSNEFEKTYYDFDGWTVGSTSGSTVADEANTDTVYSTLGSPANGATVNLYAKWKGKSYTSKLYSAYAAGSASTYSLGTTGGTVGFTSSCGNNTDTKTWTYP
ncbi:MAG: InlB B-repeat-containing protein, partial [Clostridia bacterium]|nr:InlB B-repeat-containing protein [Clostridia bacterium]